MLEKILEMEQKGIVTQLDPTIQLVSNAISKYGKELDEKIHYLMQEAGDWTYEQVDQVNNADKIINEFMDDPGIHLAGHILRVYRAIEDFDQSLESDLYKTFDEYQLSKLKLNPDNLNIESDRYLTDKLCLESLELLNYSKKRKIYFAEENDLLTHKKEMAIIKFVNDELELIIAHYSLADKDSLKKIKKKLSAKANFFTSRESLKEKAKKVRYYEGIQNINYLEEEINIVLKNYDEYSLIKQEINAYEEKISKAINYVQSKKITDLSRQKRLEILKIINTEIEIPKIRYFRDVNDFATQKQELTDFLESYVPEKIEKETEFIPKPKKGEFSLAYYVESLGIPRNPDYFIIRHILSGKTESNPMDMLEAYIETVGNYAPINNELDREYFRGLLRGLENASETSKFQKVNPVIIDKAINATRKYINS